MKKLLFFVIGLMLVNLGFGAVNNIWLKTGTNSWAVAANWSLGHTPLTTEHITFQSAGTIHVTDVPNCTIDGMRVQNAGVVYLEAAVPNPSTCGATITINNNGDFTGDYELLIVATNSLHCDVAGKLVNLQFAAGSRVDVEGPFYPAIHEVPYPATHNAECMGLLLESNSTYGVNLYEKSGSTNPVKGYFRMTFPKDGYHYICAPIKSEASIRAAGMTLAQHNGLCVCENDFIRKWDRTALGGVGDWGSWITFLSCQDASSAWELGRGYEVWADNNSGWGGAQHQWHLFYGVANKGTQTLAYDGPGWNLVGNPFPDAVIFTQGPSKPGAGWSWPAEINPVVYYWNGTAYMSYNWSTYATTNGATQYLGAMQGFFVYSNGAKSGNLTVGEAQRQVNTNKKLYKSDESPSNIVNLKLSDANGLSDEIAVYFYDGATSAFDGQYDAYKLFADGYSQVYSKTSDNIDVSMNALALTKDNVTTPIYLKTPAAGQYTIDALNLSTFSSNASIILKDLKTNATIDLKANPNYTFTVAAGDDEYRFDLLFTDVLNGINNITDNTFKIYSAGKSIFVQNNDKLNGSGNVVIYDMVGKKVMEASLDSQVTKINTNLTNGFYVVNVMSNNRSYNQKVYIN